MTPNRLPTKLAVLIALVSMLFAAELFAQTYGDTITINSQANITSVRPDSIHNRNNEIQVYDTTWFSDPRMDPNHDLEEVLGFSFATDTARADTVAVERRIEVAGVEQWVPVLLEDQDDASTNYFYIVNNVATNGTDSSMTGTCRIAEPLTGKGPVRVRRYGGKLANHQLLCRREKRYRF